MSGGIEETSASFEARSAPRSYPTTTPNRDAHLSFQHPWPSYSLVCCFIAQCRNAIRLRLFRADCIWYESRQKSPKTLPVAATRTLVSASRKLQIGQEVFQASYTKSLKG